MFTRAVPESDGRRTVFRFGPYYLNPAEHLLLRSGRRITLRPKLFETLVLLVANAGRLLTKNELMACIWPDVVVQESGLARNISALRHALNGQVASEKYVETVFKFGYRFVADVEEVVEASPRLPQNSSQPDGSEADAHVKTTCIAS